MAAVKKRKAPLSRWNMRMDSRTADLLTMESNELRSAWGEMCAELGLWSEIGTPFLFSRIVGMVVTEKRDAQTFGL